MEHFVKKDNTSEKLLRLLNNKSHPVVLGEAAKCHSDLQVAARSECADAGADRDPRMNH